MSVAITSIGTTLEDRVDERFGRARFILIVDDKGGIMEALDNSENRVAMQGAGIGAAELVADTGATSVITGHLGPKAFSALGAVGISGYQGSGLSVQEAFEQFSAGQLKRLDVAAPAHSG